MLRLACNIKMSVMRRPWNARVHAFALQVTAGSWIGYQWNKWCSKKNMSEYKHAVDFAQSHSVWVIWTGCMSRESDCNIIFSVSLTNKNQPNSNLKLLTWSYYHESLSLFNYLMIYLQVKEQICQPKYDYSLILLSWKVKWLGRQSKSGSVLFLLKKVNFETEAKFECDGYKGRL